MISCFVNRTETALSVLKILEQNIPEMISLLTVKNCYQMLIAVILSAQTTDNQVNRVVPTLFQRFPNAEKLAESEIGEVEQIVKSTGFYRVKAKNIRNTARALIDRFDGIVPESMEDLTSLPGVGRKSANVVRGHCFGLPAIIVDTHFMRVSRRIGLTQEKDPKKIEKDILTILPRELHYSFSMRVNRLGRMWCDARNPKCAECPVHDYCGHYRSQK